MLLLLSVTISNTNVYILHLTKYNVRYYVVQSVAMGWVGIYSDH